MILSQLAIQGLQAFTLVCDFYCTIFEEFSYGFHQTTVFYQKDGLCRFRAVPKVWFLSL